MSIKGYTLVEMLVVFTMISILWVLLMFTPWQRNTLDIELKHMKELLLQAQQTAMKNHEVMQIDFKHKQLQINDQIYEFGNGITTQNYAFFFNEFGNISKAGTLCFYQWDMKKCLVFELGSGRIAIR